MTPRRPQDDPNMTPTWGSFGVHLGSMWGPCGRSESNLSWRPPRESNLTPLGPILEPSWPPCWPHVGPMLGPCWRPLGILGHLGALLELILRPFLINIEQKMKGRGWILEKPSKTNSFRCFLKFPRFQHEASWGCFWGHLGGLGAILEASWASWGRLDGVLGRLGVLGNAEERLTMLACV